mmetsp:Transcript_32222/g.46964  ORF Transcript_32222/g.46964 Transcript_32222/m.46964 type:complete len:189 (+) Transcript_32222:33-599(+)|eukprot:8021026-Ditylum_brightwellii.AAC.1
MMIENFSCPVDTSSKDAKVFLSSPRTAKRAVEMTQKPIRIRGFKSARTDSCSIFEPRSCDGEESITERELLYNRATWRMYNRIMQSRETYVQRYQIRQQPSPSSRNVRDSKLSVWNDDILDDANKIFISPRDTSYNKVVFSSRHQNINNIEGKNISSLHLPNICNDDSDRVPHRDIVEMPFAMDMLFD